MSEEGATSMEGVSMAGDKPKVNITLRECDILRISKFLKTTFRDELRGELTKDQDQDQDSLLVKRRNDNHSPGPVIRELVPSSHQRSELSNTILCIFSG